MFDQPLILVFAHRFLHIEPSCLFCQRTFKEKEIPYIRKSICHLLKFMLLSEMGYTYNFVLRRTVYCNANGPNFYNRKMLKAKFTYSTHISTTNTMCFYLTKQSTSLVINNKHWGQSCIRNSSPIFFPEITAVLNQVMPIQALMS